MPEAKVTAIQNEIKAFIHCKRCIEEWKVLVEEDFTLADFPPELTREEA